MVMDLSAENMNKQAEKSIIVSIGVLVSHFASVLLVKPDVDAEWQLPRLVQDWCETMPDAIQRAVYEQTAIRVEAGGVIQVYDMISAANDSHSILMDFEAVYVGGDLSRGHQVADVAWASGLALGSMAVEENTLELLTDMEFI